MSETSEKTRYYYSIKCNYAAMITKKGVVTYYQVKFYSYTGETKHHYGKSIAITLDSLKQTFPDLQEGTQEDFFRVAIDYYSKEKENAELFKNYLYEKRNKTL